MAKCLIIVPWANGTPIFPGVSSSSIQGFLCGSFVPPPVGTPSCALVWLKADAAAITALTNRPDCLFICNVLADGSFETAGLTATQRNTVRTKITAMGFTGDQFGLLNAAIQASQNRTQLAVAIATLAFFQNKLKQFMTEAQLRNTRLP